MTTVLRFLAGECYNGRGLVGLIVFRAVVHNFLPGFDTSQDIGIWTAWIYLFYLYRGFYINMMGVRCMNERNWGFRGIKTNNLRQS